jgi:hypothetical protein
MKKIILCSLWLFTSHSYGEGTVLVGNGGDVIVCKDAVGSILSVELLDFYEIDKVNSFPVDINPALTQEEALDELLSRLTL